MIRRSVAVLPRYLGRIFGVVAAWVGVFTLNESVLAATQHSSRANWVFLPAAVRLLAVLLFGEVGAVGVVFGSLLTLPHAMAIDPAYNAALAISSGAAPLAAVLVSRQFMAISRNMGGLRAWHILVLSVSCAASNAIVLNGYMWASGHLHGDFIQIATVFVRDMLGTAIVLFVLSNLLAFTLPQPRNV